MTFDGLPRLRAVPTATAAQMAEVDRVTIEELHIPVDVLMENAGRQVAAAARAFLAGNAAGKRVIALVGSGNNGGDAVVALRHLVNWGARVRAELAAPRGRMRETTRGQLGRLLLANPSDVAMVHEAPPKGLRDLEADLVIDGLLGYSARGAPRDTVAAVIEAANASRVPILAVDLPSGIAPDGGAVPGVAIRAAVTVTLALPKPGLLDPTARDCVGELLLADIAIPHAAFARIGVDTARLFEQGDLVRIEVGRSSVVGSYSSRPMSAPDLETRRANLSPIQYAVTQQARTEPPFTGAYWDHHGEGTYRCVVCGEPLFDSGTKFESGTGWPSFYDVVEKGHVKTKEDRTLGMLRTEVECAHCGAHLGHLFPDGPDPTGTRYCINSAALDFTPKTESDPQPGR